LPHPKWLCARASSADLFSGFSLTGALFSHCYRLSVHISVFDAARHTLNAEFRLFSFRHASLSGLRRIGSRLNRPHRIEPSVAEIRGERLSLADRGCFRIQRKATAGLQHQRSRSRHKRRTE
jgi:hypothetical protein